MNSIHILRRKADEHIKLWCPYCDEVVMFGYQHYYEELWCTQCKRVFSPSYKHHHWPKGLNAETGELEGVENG